ncbi:hypothetical protein AAZX31_19G054000 [Glycine max]|uniref:uncharacterized protein LOC114404593 n=1 Tax=Glycine soja TaxID=3848 RepID=UPI00103D04B0|nr:uncharacterized protein LOC114404593 [Glycine soja]
MSQGTKPHSRTSIADLLRWNSLTMSHISLPSLLCFAVSFVLTMANKHLQAATTMISLINYIRIFYKKVEYVLEDCNEVLVKINKFVVNKEGLVCVETLCMPVTKPERFELDAFELDEPEDAGRYIVRKSIKSAKDIVRFPFQQNATILYLLHTVYRGRENLPLLTVHYVALKLWKLQGC